MRKEKVIAILFALLAAVFYAINLPFSKTLLQSVEPTMMAGLLYLGAGIGVGIMSLFSKDRKEKDNKLNKKDLPYTMGMVALDIVAPIVLMFGILHTTSSNASLLNNFEIVATSIIALVIFKEKISKRLWSAILLITVSSAILSFEDISSFKFSWGSILVLLAALCWGFENNCTRKISDKSTYQIVTIKGTCCGIGSVSLALITGEKLPEIEFILFSLLLGFFAYGLSIFFYIKAQSVLGAAKTSAYYAVAPFVASFLSFVILKEQITLKYIIALVIMLIGSVIVVVDTLIISHSHAHQHIVTHSHDGVEHQHILTHTHSHSHLNNQENHIHYHKVKLQPH